MFWLATAKNLWFGSFHRQCEPNANNCLTTNRLWAFHTLPCYPTSHDVRRIWCYCVLTHVHVPSELNAWISLHIDYTLAAFGSLIACRVVTRTTFCLNVSLFSQYMHILEWTGKMQLFNQFVCTTCAMVFKVECCVGTRALLCFLCYGIISRPAAKRHCVPNIVCLMTTLFPITESVFESILCWTNHAF